MSEWDATGFKGQGIGIKAVKAGYEILATVDTPFQQVFDQATAFTSVCRGSKEKHVTQEATCPRRS